MFLVRQPIHPAKINPLLKVSPPPTLHQSSARLKMMTTGYVLFQNRAGNQFQLVIILHYLSSQLSNISGGGLTPPFTYTICITPIPVS